MEKKSKLKATKKRVKVKDLPAKSKKMSGREMKQVKGGHMVVKGVMVTNAKPTDR